MNKLLLVKKKLNRIEKATDRNIFSLLLKSLLRILNINERSKSIRKPRHIADDDFFVSSSKNEGKRKINLSDYGDEENGEKENLIILRALQNKFSSMTQICTLM